MNHGSAWLNYLIPYDIDLLPQPSLFYFIQLSQHSIDLTWCTHDLMFPRCFSMSFTCPLHICGLFDMAWLVVWPRNIDMSSKTWRHFPAHGSGFPSTIHHHVAPVSGRTLNPPRNYTIFQIAFLLQPVSREKCWIYQRSTKTQRMLNMKTWSVWKSIWSLCAHF